MGWSQKTKGCFENTHPPKNFHSSPLKNDGWKIFSFWNRLFLGAVLNFQGVSPAKSFSFSEFFTQNKCQIYQRFAKYNRTREFSTRIRVLKWSIIIFPLEMIIIKLWTNPRVGTHNGGTTGDGWDPGWWWRQTCGDWISPRWAPSSRSL